MMQTDALLNFIFIINKLFLKVFPAENKWLSLYPVHEIFYMCRETCLPWEKSCGSEEAIFTFPVTAATEVSL